MEYHPTKMKPLVQIIMKFMRENPEAKNNPEFVMACLGEIIPGFNDKTKCINCGASMAMTKTSLNFHTALLVYLMSKEVIERNRTRPFTEANKIHVSSNPNIIHSCQCHTTQAAKLGLIAKSGEAKWVITKLGYKALRGGQIPASRIMFRGQIVDRPDETTTFAKIFKDHSSRGSSDTTDYDDYNPRDYAEVAGYSEGLII